jgi:hypothetical protein
MRTMKWEPAASVGISRWLRAQVPDTRRVTRDELLALLPVPLDEVERRIEAEARRERSAAVQESHVAAVVRALG